jgi:hypothetical protein
MRPAATFCSGPTILVLPPPSALPAPSVHGSLWISSRPVAVMTPPRTQTPPSRVLDSGARPTSGVETLEIISPELALVDPELATRARASLRTHGRDELVDAEQPAPDADEIRPASSGDEETVLSPELALIDPELADRARAQLADGKPTWTAAPVPQPGRAPRPLPPPRASRPEPVVPRRRAWRKGGVIVTGIVLAAGLGGAAAIWARYNDGARGSRGIEQAPFQPLRERSAATAVGGRGETTTARASKQVIGGQRSGRSATRSPRKGIGGSAPGRGVQKQTLRRLRPAAFHVPGAPKEPLDEIPLPARARRLEAWLTRTRGPTAANERHWLYQHAWIVTGARFGWWHGAEALRVLIRVDRRVESQWGVGYRSEAVARGALAAVRRIQRQN